MAASLDRFRIAARLGWIGACAYGCGVRALALTQPGRRRDMQLKEYAQIVLARWWLVAIVILSAGVASYLFTRLQTPLYRATASMTFIAARPDNGQTLAAQSLSRQAVAQITTERLARSVDERGRFDLGVDALKTKVRASAIENQALLALEITDTDPDRARRLSRR